MKKTRLGSRQEYVKDWKRKNKDRVNAKRRETRKRPEVMAKEQAYNTAWVKKRRLKDPTYGPMLYERYGKPWREKNYEHVLELGRADYHRNKTKRQQARKDWGAKNPEKQRQIWTNKHARSKGARGTCSLEQWYNRCSMFLWRCAYCGTELNKTTVTRDHVIPLSRGGSNWPANLVPACRSCNNSKHAKVWIPQVFQPLRALSIS